MSLETKTVAKSEFDEKEMLWEIECSDEEIYYGTKTDTLSKERSKYFDPESSEIISLYGKLADGEQLLLKWKSPGRRSPTLKKKSLTIKKLVVEPKPIKVDETDLILQDFDMSEEGPSLVRTPRRPNKFGQKTPVSQKRVASLDKIMNDIRRHKKLNESNPAINKGTPNRRGNLSYRRGAAGIGNRGTPQGIRNPNEKLLPGVSTIRSQTPTASGRPLHNQDSSLLNPAVTTNNSNANVLPLQTSVAVSRPTSTTDTTEHMLLVGSGKTTMKSDSNTTSTSSSSANITLSHKGMAAIMSTAVGKSITGSKTTEDAVKISSPTVQDKVTNFDKSVVKENKYTASSGAATSETSSPTNPENRPPIPKLTLNLRQLQKQNK